MWNYIHCIYLCALVNKITFSYIIVINTALLKIDIFYIYFYSKVNILFYIKIFIVIIIIIHQKKMC